MLASNEAWTDAAERSNGLDASLLVRVEGGVTSDEVMIAVSDSGPIGDRPARNP